MFKVIILATILAVAAAKPGLIAEIAPTLEYQNTGYLGGYTGLPLPLNSRYYQQQQYLQSGYLQPSYLQTEYLPSTSSYQYNYNSGLKYLGSGAGLQYQYNKSPYYNYYY